MKNLICRGLIVVLTVFLQLMPCYATTESGYINDRWVGNVQYSVPSKDSNGEYKVTIENVDGTSMSIPSSVTLTYYNADNDTTKDYECYVSSVSIPDHVETASVSSAGKLYGVYAIGGSLKSISCEGDFTELSLKSCNSLEEASLAGAIKRIIFNDCNLLTSIAIPSGVTGMSFLRCSSLKSVTILSGVTSIGTFQNCSSLTSVTIPSSVTSIGNSAFQNCSSLTSVTIPGGVTSIGNSAFQNCSSLTSVTIPSRATVGVDAFAGCSSLVNLEFSGSSGGSLGGAAFYGCTSLKEIEIPSQEIGNSAFKGCSSLEKIKLLSGVSVIGSEAFADCENLMSFEVAAGNKAYTSYDGALFTKDMKTLISYPAGRVDVKIPEGATVQNEDVFAGCRKLWTEWYRMSQKTRYDLSGQLEDRAISSITISGDTSLDSFVLRDGKVFDAVLRIENVSSGNAKVTLPSGYTYETFTGATPLIIPAMSRNIMTLTRTAENTFLVSREVLTTVQ